MSSKRIQFFQIANLIFTTPEDSTILINSRELEIIQNRFLDIVNSFAGEQGTHYATNFIKQGNPSLPYNSMAILGAINNRLILHFTFSYKEPILFVIDINDNKVKNYIDMEDAKNILDDDIFQDVKDALHYHKRLDRLFKGVTDINNFISKFETALNEHNNLQSITGRDCFEINLNDIEEDDPGEL